MALGPLSFCRSRVWPGTFVCDNNADMGIFQSPPAKTINGRQPHVRVFINAAPNCRTGNRCVGGALCTLKCCRRSGVRVHCVHVPRLPAGRSRRLQREHARLAPF